MSGLCRQWTEKFEASFDRGLTARPVVLAKTYEPGRHAPAVSGDPGRTFFRSFLPEGSSSRLHTLRTHAMPAALVRERRRGAEPVSIRLRPAALAR
jgi:hypothetical protein